MPYILSLRGIALPTLQTLLVLCGLALLTLWPPAKGRMLLVPLTAGASRTLIVTAVEKGARLVARGPVDGSMIVSGDSSRLMGALARQGIIAMVAPAGGCGSEGERA